MESAPCLRRRIPAKPGDGATLPRTLPISPRLGASIGSAPSIPQMHAVVESGIVEVFNYGRNRQGLIPLWVGEGDLTTPDFIADAAQGLARQGRDFLHLSARHSRTARDDRALHDARLWRGAGRRRSSARAFLRHHRRHACAADRHAARRRDRATKSSFPRPPGRISTARSRWPARAASMFPMVSGARWSLDIDRLAAAITPATRAIIVNSPGNPTGFTATLDELAAILDLSRRHGLVDHRRRNLWAPRLSGRARAFVPRCDGPGRPRSCSCRRCRRTGR